MRQVAAAAAALGLAVAAARADQLEFTTYRFSDVGDNEVVTSSFSLAKTLWKRTRVVMDLEVDRITVPPLEGDAVTGASRPRRQANQAFEKSRGQGIVGLEQGLGDNTALALSYYQSREVDYFSQAAFGSFTQELFQKNVTLQLRGQYTADDVGEILANGALETNFKETHQGAFTLTQLLGPATTLRLGGDVFRLRGFLSDPYRYVHRSAGDTSIVRENHPAERWRMAACAGISQYLPVEASLILDYRYYFDDWGMRAHTADVKLNKYVTSDIIASPAYRYHVQTGADFGDYAGHSPGLYVSGDYKLKAFDSNNIGMSVTYFLRGVAARRGALDFLGGASLSVMFFRYWNSLDFAANVLESKVTFGF